MDLFDLAETFGSMHSALSRVKCPIMVIGVKTDMLFPVWQQRELAQHLQEAGACQKRQTCTVPYACTSIMYDPDKYANYILIATCSILAHCVTGNNAVTYYELNSIYGHDTFLLDLNGVGAGVKVSAVDRYILHRHLLQVFSVVLYTCHQSARGGHCYVVLHMWLCGFYRVFWTHIWQKLAERENELTINISKTNSATSTSNTLCKCTL